MKIKSWLLAGVACVACLSASKILAQDRPGRGNFDFSQFRERMMENLKDRMEVKDDAEWKAIQPLIEKVFDARRQLDADRVRGMMGGRSGRPPGENASSNDQGDRRSSRGGFGGEPSKEAEELQKAIDAKASNADLKAALAKFKESRKTKQAELEKAQAELRKVLSVRQEAVAALAGLL